MTNTRRLHVLAVEDECLLLMLIADTLTGVGCTVSGATSGDEALSQARLRAPDLVVLNVRLAGGLEGAALLDRLRAAVSRPLPAVIVTGMALSEKERLLFDVADGARPAVVVTKPFLPAELAEAVLALAAKADDGRQDCCCAQH